MINSTIFNSCLNGIHLTHFLCEAHHHSFLCLGALQNYPRGHLKLTGWNLQQKALITAVIFLYLLIAWVLDPNCLREGSNPAVIIFSDDLFYISESINFLSFVIFTYDCCSLWKMFWPLKRMSLKWHFPFACHLVFPEFSYSDWALCEIVMTWFCRRPSSWGQSW